VHNATVRAEEQNPAMSHVDGEGRARMVDVGGKPATARRAEAEGVVAFGAEAFRLLEENRLAKGDALAVARLAGIQAGKRASEWIPLCHPIGLDALAVEIRLDAGTRRAVVTAEARTRAATGVEMEAMVAVSAACLALYDMTKGIDRGARIGPIRLLAKDGGKSGAWRAEGEGA
jgi:cyclic pyranopterin phosphate synthase